MGKCRAVADDPPNEPSPKERARLEQQAKELNERGVALYDQGRYPEARKLLQEALGLRRQLYPKGRYPQGHPDLATSLNNLGSLLQAQGEYGQALDCFQQALHMCQQLYPKEQYPQGHPALALFSATLSVMVACLLRVECGTWPCPTPSMTRINPSPSRALSGMGVRGTRSVGKPARPFPVPTACGRVQR